MATVLNVVPLVPPTQPEAPPGADEAPGIPVTLLLVWTVAALACVAFVLYGFEPLFQQRTQSHLLTTYRTQLQQATGAAADPTLTAKATRTPRRGAPVALLEIGALRLQQVVIEGARPRQTKDGPGHVPGTSGPGQPGNAVIVGRQSMFGGPFRSLAKLRVGDRIVVTTTQGQSTYRVQSNRTPAFGGTSVNSIEGPSSDDRLTLVTSASKWPLNGSRARVVVARMEHAAFPPTKQATRRGSESGARADAGGLLAAFVAVVLAVGACLGAIWCYMHLSTRTAYLITAIPLVVIVVVTSEALSRLVPAWL